MPYSSPRFQVPFLLVTCQVRHPHLHLNTSGLTVFPWTKNILCANTVDNILLCHFNPWFLPSCSWFWEVLTGYQRKIRHTASRSPSCICSLGPTSAASADVFMRAIRNGNFTPRQGKILCSDWCGNRPAVCILDGCKAVSWHTNRAVATSASIIISAIMPQTQLCTHTHQQQQSCLAWGFQAEDETKQEKSMVC